MEDKNGIEPEEGVQAQQNENTVAEQEIKIDSPSDTPQDEEQNDVGRLRKELEQVRAERDEFREHVVRKVAELENFRRRTEQEKADTIRWANQDLLAKFLPLLDDLHRAVESGRESKEYASLMEGIELVYNKARQLFIDAGVSTIDVEGKPFDVNLHEALMHIHSDHPEGIVIQEVERGYMYRDKVVRHAKVITSAGPQERAETGE